MAIRITEDRMTSSVTWHTADYRPAPGDGTPAGWVCDRVPGRRLTRNEAITAMTLSAWEAEGRAADPHCAGWRAELGIVDAVPDLPPARSRRLG